MTTKDLNAVITDINGQPIVDKDKTTTVKDMIITGLLAVLPDEQNLGGEEKFKRFTLATKINDAKDGIVDLTPEEIVTIKHLVGRVFGSLAVGQIYKLLNA